MSSTKPISLFPLSVAVAALVALSACGGSDDAATALQPDVTLAGTVTDLDEAAAAASQPNWPAWSGGKQPVAGVGCANSEAYHAHTLVSIYRNGTRLAMPGSVGIGACTYELHTHDGSGVVHVETDVRKDFTLSQYFALWGQVMSASDVAGLPGPYRFYLVEDGKLSRYTGDPGAIVLSAHREIVILAGPKPPAVLPKYRWPAEL